MRTTLDIADDVLLAAKEQARRDRRSVGAVLSDLARIALTQKLRAGLAEQGESFYGFEPLPSRGKPVTNAWIDQLREEDLD
jgi:hypothetical protein